MRDDVENVEAGDGDDVLTGSAFDNVLGGNRGNDTLSGGAGRDVLRGDDGIDTGSYAGRAGGVVVDLRVPGGDGGDEDEHADDVSTEHLIGSDGPDDLTGTDDSDLIQGGRGADALHGALGDDTLMGGRDPDVLDGGKGRDVASYADDAPFNFDDRDGVHVFLDGLPNDGDVEDEAPGGVRDLAIVEDVVGGPFDDEIVGDRLPNFFAGGGGDDVLRGGDGADELVGGTDEDTVLGEDGDDDIDANDGTIDSVACGAGADQADLDLRDVDAVTGVVPSTPADCERTARAPVGELPAVQILARRLGSIVPLRCPRAVKTAGCRGVLEARSGDAVLGRARYRLRRGEAGRVRLRLRGRPTGPVVLEALERARDGRPRTMRVTLAG